jgi:uncharacterized Zn-finger protein
MVNPDELRRSHHKGRIHKGKKRLHSKKPFYTPMPAHDVFCAYCGKKFSTTQPNAQCCCRVHANALYYKEHHSDQTIQGYSKVKKCPGCGALFVTTRDKRRYCYNQTCVKKAKAERDKDRRTK